MLSCVLLKIDISHSGRPSVLPAAAPCLTSHDRRLAGIHWNVFYDFHGTSLLAGARFPVEGLLSLASTIVADLASAAPLVPHAGLLVGVGVPGCVGSTRVELGSGVAASAGFTDLDRGTLAALVLDRHLSTLSEGGLLAATILSAVVFCVF